MAYYILYFIHKYHLLNKIFKHIQIMKFLWFSPAERKIWNKQEDLFEHIRSPPGILDAILVM